MFILERNMFRYIFVSLVLVSTLYSYCREPMKPICIGSSTSFKTFKNSCRDNVEDYIKNLERYTECVVSESRNKIQEAIDSYKCYASGENFCY